MRLSNSFEKRRLGKQQQILSDMTQRCREQEVTDLSSRISAKCDLKAHDKGAHANPFYSTTTRAGKGRLPSDFALDGSSPEVGYGAASPTGSLRHNGEKAYKFFPARHIMRQQTKINPISPNATLPKVSSSGLKPNSTAGTDTFRSPRYFSRSFQNLEAVGLDSPRRFRPHAGLDSTYPQTSRAEPLAPLVLPRLSMVDMGYQDRIDSYFSSNPLATAPRAKTILDAGSISGRSYRSLINLSGRTNKQSILHGRSGHKSERSEHALMNIPFQHDDDRHSMESIGRGFGQSIDNLIS